MKSRKQMYQKGWISLWNYLDIDCCNHYENSSDNIGIGVFHNIGRPFRKK